MSGDHTKREITVTRVEYAIPSGADIKDFGLVEEWAWQDYCRRSGREAKSFRSDNWCTVNAHDEEVVFAFTVEQPVDRAAQRAHDDLAECVADRDSALRQAASLNGALNRVRALLESFIASDGVRPSWVSAVRDAIEGRS
jgi:hypothetical protein